MNRTDVFNSRETSFIILSDYIYKKSDLKNIINRWLEKYALSASDRRFVYEIVKGTVRYLFKIDYLISFFSKLNIEKIDIAVLNILRTAVYQFMFMPGVPGYSIVNESVNISKKHSGVAASKFVNALLRKIGNVEDLLNYTDDKIDRNPEGPVQRLVLKYSFPLWLVNYWLAQYGKKRTERLLASLNKPSLNFLRINTMQTNKKNLIGLLSENGFIINRDFSVLSADIEHKLFRDTILMKSLQNMENFPGYSQGLYSVQDFASQFAVKNFLKPRPGEKILDLCGAPGGKATYIAELTDDRCEIVSVDINENKIKMFNRNVERLGIKNIKILKSDVTDRGFLSFKNYFDKIFIDCPCSALGTISRNPDVKYNKSINDIKRLSDQSLKILYNCRDYLNREKGKIVFYTCTLSKIENQDVVEKFSRENKNDFKLKKFTLPRTCNDYLKRRKISPEPDKFLEIFPYYFDSEGGFVAEIHTKKSK